ncbi:MAG: AMP-binding protein [Alphaproteobacteria bacterium]
MLHDFIEHAERFNGRRLAIVDGERRMTYAESAARVRRAAGGLAAMGLPPGSHVAVAAENGAFFFEAYFACSLAGLVAAPLNIRLSPDEIAFMVRDADCRLFLHDGASAHLAPAGMDALTEEGWAALAATAEPLGAPAGPQDPEGLAHICYTGGSTGRPKGVMLSHRNVAASVMNKLVLGKFARDDVWLHAAPMFHQADSWAAFAFTALGARHVFLPRFDAVKALDLIEGEQVTGFQLVPTMIVMMLEETGAQRRDLASLRRILYGSAPMPVPTLERAAAAFGPVFQHIYGLTECAGTVAATPWPADAAEMAGERMRSCGQPVTGVSLRIAREDGAAAPAGEVGRIQAKGANVMAGYWNRPEESAAAFVDGWLETGDLGRMDEDGFVYIVDRAKDMIITGGENVYSAEVENALSAHPDVLEAAVVGLPHPRWGEAVTAAVTIRQGAAATVPAHSVRP